MFTEESSRPSGGQRDPRTAAFRAGRPSIGRQTERSSRTRSDRTTSVRPASQAVRARLLQSRLHMIQYLSVIPDVRSKHVPF